MPRQPTTQIYYHPHSEHVLCSALSKFIFIFTWLLVCYFGMPEMLDAHTKQSFGRVSDVAMAVRDVAAVHITEQTAEAMSCNRVVWFETQIQYTIEIKCNIDTDCCISFRP